MSLNEEEELKLKQVLEAWEDTHRAIKFFKFVGKALVWIVGLGAGVATIWGVYRGH